MGGTCSCLQSDRNLLDELNLLESSKGKIDSRSRMTPNQLSELIRLSKCYLTKKYLKQIKSSQAFTVPFPYFKGDLKSVESETIKKTEEEYGEYRTTPVWGEYTIPLQPILIENTIYRGEWDFFSKLPHGTGIIYNQTTGEKYSGNLKMNKKHGLGRLVFSNGDLYEGEFFEGEMHGNGTLVYIQGKVYIGEFCKGLKHGYGKEQDRHETCYEGEYLNNKKSGNGKLIWADGRCYVGEFFDDKMHGVGECLWPDDKRYYGEWVKDKMHGQGEFLWSDGREYYGQYYQNLEDGNGKMIFSNGDLYEGTWRRGKQHGFGVLKDSNGERKGEWRDGKFIRWIID